jgi:calcium-translocating P-type ATPase
MSTWHSSHTAAVAEHFRTSIESGLSAQSIAQSRSQYGYNELPPPPEESKLLLFLKQFNDPIIYILIAAGIINGLVSDMTDAAVIAFVVFLNTIIGFVQESRAAAALESLKSFSPAMARVVRDGVQIDIQAREIIPGDIILLESGMRVPADARLVDSSSLLIDEAMLTGESVASEKKHTATVAGDAPLGDRITMVYSGAVVVRGRGRAIVTAIGEKTEIGIISKSLAETEEQSSPLEERLEDFGKKLSIAIMTTMAIIFVAGVFRDGQIGEGEILKMLLTSVALAVSAIPEGLPVSVTVTLSIGLYQMAQRNAIIRKLPAVETLGSTTVICSDKTGTLTQNQMTAVHIFTEAGKYDITGTGYNKKGEIVAKGNVQAAQNKAIEWSVRIGTLCSETRLEDAGESFTVVGDPTEAALLVLGHKAQFKEQWAVTVDMPFESELQFMGVNAKRGSEQYVLIKGAPEVIMRKCSAMLSASGEEVAMNLNAITNCVEEYSGEGLRVLGLAYRKTEQAYTHDDMVAEQSLVFAGLVASVDPPREEAKFAVKECQAGGIRVKMITGDHVKTASSIARQLGIAKDHDVHALEGKQIEAMSDDELFKVVEDTDVFARVSPIHKQRIVQQLQRKNHIVGMTGDGVNDAPSLNQADIGIAMGAGTDIAKDVSAMVILDNNFATIVEAVRRGRVIFSNLQHIIMYILSTSLGGVLTVATSVFLGIPLPLLPAQLLWINLVTDGTSTFPLAFEKEHGNMMTQQPRKRESPLISRRMAIRIVLSGTLMMIGATAMYFWGMAQYGTDNAHARTIAFCTLAFFQIWNVQNSRSVERSLFFNLHIPGDDPSAKTRVKVTDNLPSLGVMLLAAILQACAVLIPFMNVVLKTTPLTLQEWGMVLGVSSTIIIFAECEKIIVAWWQRRQVK